MILRYLFNCCCCPLYVDEEELKTNISSDTSTEKTIPPPDFIPTNEHSFNTINSTSYAWYQFIKNN